MVVGFGGVEGCCVKSTTGLSQKLRWPKISTWNYQVILHSFTCFAMYDKELQSVNCCITSKNGVNVCFYNNYTCSFIVVICFVYMGDLCAQFLTHNSNINLCSIAKGRLYRPPHLFECSAHRNDLSPVNLWDNPVKTIQELSFLDYQKRAYYT